MKVKLYSYLFLLVLFVAAAWIISRRNSTVNNERISRTNERRYEDERKTGFNRKTSYLEYTVHARCRMQCRHISQAEVRDILKNGKINYSKSNLKEKPCPTYALEGYTRQDNQHVRIVFAQCLQKTKVVTCIDLDEDFACECS